MDASALDRDVCREHLAEVLAEEANLLIELRSLLEREYEVLGTKDAIAVERTVLARQERMGALARVEEQRRSLCSMHGYSADHAGLERLMVWCDPQGTLVSRLRDCAKFAADCRDLKTAIVTFSITVAVTVIDRLQQRSTAGEIIQARP